MATKKPDAKFKVSTIERLRATITKQPALKAKWEAQTVVAHRNNTPLRGTKSETWTVVESRHFIPRVEFVAKMAHLKDHMKYGEALHMSFRRHVELKDGLHFRDRAGRLRHLAIKDTYQQADVVDLEQRKGARDLFRSAEKFKVIMIAEYVVTDYVDDDYFESERVILST